MDTLRSNFITEVFPALTLLEALKTMGLGSGTVEQLGSRLQVVMEDGLPLILPILIECIRLYFSA